MTVVIKRNTAFGTKHTKIFTTDYDNQPVIGFKVFEGEHSLTRDNYFLGEFELSDIPPARRGVPAIEVTFDVDPNGILDVTAIDKISGKKNRITITNDKGRLSKDEIERIIADAENYKKEENTQHERISAKNSLELYCFKIRESTDDDKTRSKFSKDDEKKINQIIESTIAWIETTQVYIRYLKLVDLFFFLLVSRKR